VRHGTRRRLQESCLAEPSTSILDRQARAKLAATTQVLLDYKQRKRVSTIGIRILHNAQSNHQPINSRQANSGQTIRLLDRSQYITRLGQMNERSDGDEMEIEDVVSQMRELGEELMGDLHQNIGQSSPRGPAGIISVDHALAFLDQIERMPQNLDLNQYHDFSDITVVLDTTRDARLATKLIGISFDDSDISMRDGLLPLLKNCKLDSQICDMIRGLLREKPPNKLEWTCALAEWFPSMDYASDLLSVCTNDDYSTDAQDRSFGALEALVQEFNDSELKAKVDSLRQTRFEHLA